MLPPEYETDIDVEQVYEEATDAREKLMMLRVHKMKHFK